MLSPWRRAVRAAWSGGANLRGSAALRRTPREQRRRLAIEPLESRHLLAVLSVFATDPLASEGESTATLVFTRDGSLTQPLSVSFAVGGTAESGVDFASLGGAVIFPAGQASISIAVTPIADSVAEATESVTVTLGPVAGYAIDLGAATVNIRDAFDGASVGALVPLSETFQLHSLPGAHHTIYLDFDGGTVQDPAWNGGATINVDPFDLDGIAGFSNSELATIQNAWEVVAEDYRPFAVDVTTELPNIERLRKVGTSDNEWGVRVMIGDPTNFNVGATGRAQTGSFSANYDEVAWVDLSNSGFTIKNARTVGGIASHEVGHTLYLSHDGGTPGGEYYEGQGTGEADWSPIMGNIFPSSITTWSNGAYPTANNPEDDLAIISTQNGFTYRPDDHADTPSLATPLVMLGSNHWIGEGVIERNTDFDLFSFVSSGGAPRISIAPTSVSPNVDLRAELYDSSMTLVAVSDVTDQLAASFEQSLPTGTYYVRVTGTGNRTWSTGGYDDYASLGAYSIEIGGFGKLASFIPSGSTNSSTPLAGTTQFSGVTVGGLTQHGTSSSTNTNAWPIGWTGGSSQDLNQYVTFTVTPTAPAQLDFQQLTVTLKSWVASSSTVAIRSSRDGFAANIDGTRTLAANASSDLTFNVASVADSTSTVEFRLYVWAGGSGFRDLHRLELRGRTLSTPVNEPPVANNDSASSDGSATVISVLANDTDPNGDVLAVQSISSLPAHGTAVLNANNTVTYTPNSGYAGTDSFSYIATDGSLNSAPAVVTVTVVDDPPPPPPPAGVAAQYTVNQNPRLQLGNAPLTGYAGSSLDQVAILWQTTPAGSGTQDTFTVQYRRAGTVDVWQSANAIVQTVTGVGGRIVHEATVTGLQWNSDYEYRVRHLRAGGLVQQWSSSFRTRLESGDSASFSFVAYGDSAAIASNTGFRQVQNRINLLDPNFAVLLGDNVYESGTHAESDARFDPDLNPEAASWMASHIDYLGLGNHDVIYSGNEGRESEQNFAVPIPVAGVTAPVAPPATERPEHNFSWDYGDVHFVTFDTNAWNDSARRDGLLDYVIADLNASTARWKIVYGHHPIAAAPDKASEWDSATGQAYYNAVVDRFTAAGVDLFLVGHSHTFSWTHPLTGRDNSGNITYDHGTYDSFTVGDGLPQVVSGTGGKDLRSGVYSTEPYVAAGWTTSEAFVDGVVNPTSQRVENGFAKIDVTPDHLTISYVAADDGSVIDSFTITQSTDTTGPSARLSVPLDNGSSDMNSAVDQVLVNQTQPVFRVQLQDATTVDDASVTSGTVTLSRDGVVLASGVDYTFGFDAVNDVISVTPATGDFGDGTYEIGLSAGAAITDTLGNAMPTRTLSIVVDTTIQPPVTVTFQDGVLGYTGTIDTWLQASLPTTSNATSTMLGVDGSPVEHTLIRFSSLFGTSAGQIPPGATIQSASLKLNLTDPGDVANLHRMLISWSDTATWDSLGSGIQADGQEAAVAAEGQLSGATGLASLDVTSALTAWAANPASNFGWVLLPTASNGIDIASSEATTISQRPVLSVTYVSNGTPPSNHAPEAVNDSTSTNKGVSVSINVLANDSDVDGDPLTPSLVSTPANGSASVNSNGSIIYTPVAGFVGNDSFTYRVSDGTLFSNDATVSISVIDSTRVFAQFDPIGAQGSGDLHGSSNVAGTTVGDLHRVGATSGTNTDVWPVYWYSSTTVDPTQYLTFSVTPAATDLADFTKLTVSFQEWVTGTSNVAVRTSLDGYATNVGGVQTLSDTGSADVTFDLTPLPWTVGTTTFRIYVFDSVDGTAGWRDIRSSLWNTGKGVRLEGSTATNNTPIAVDDVASTNEDTSAVVSVLTNDSDADGQTLTPTLVSTPAHGQATINSNGTITYTPALNFSGSDSFTYRVSDGALSSGIATVNLSVAPVNDPPVAVNDAYMTDYNVALDVSATAGVLANDTDVDGPALTASLLSSTSHGTLTFQSNGSFHYTPAVGYIGADSFTYSASDGLLSSQATVSLTVKAPPDDHGNLPNSTATSISLSGGTRGRGSSSGIFEIVGDRDVFKVSVVSGSLAVNLNGLNGLDTYLRVYNSSGTQVAFDDDSGPGPSSALTISVTTGTYYLSAGSSGDGFTGSFTLDVELRAQTSVTFTPGVNGYSSASDTYVSGNYPTTSFATWNMIQVDYTSATKQEQSLVQFKNLFGSAAGQIPFGSEILSATFTFYVTNGGNRVNVHRMLTPWTDASTWNSLNAGVSANDVEAAAVPETQTPLSTPTGWQSINVKASVSAWLANPTTNFGWAFLPTGTDGVDFYSVNNSSSWVPRLAVDYLAPNGDQHVNAPGTSATVLTPINNRALAFGTLETAGDRDVFQFTLTQQRTVTINLSAFVSGSTLNTYLRLYNQSGTLIAEDDDAGPGSDSTLTLSLNAGSYYVSVGSYQDVTVGDYWLELFL